ncbi:MAG: MerR family transcriptional regulator [Oscillospiraceae bacterium]|jgi:DNA-binding transcriptional MerR regulator|nr:MerR family transcriptional regulator [Oscillospiraceae bacterium]MCI8714732.1 MerR family transcriptional regulator [Oscillospiraceae bacterium]MCI9316768.1 MerR family transcriptional regulator [Oscillospiraceae bacterium]
MEKKSRLLTIGQFAALHGINRKTLMWYDQIGLFQPAYIHPENGYRYYSYYQSSILETILLLRELDVSIDEIQEFMHSRSAASLERLLGEKIAELERTMAHLRAVRKTLVNHRRNMQTLLSMDLSEISLVEKEERRLVTVDISPETSFDRQVEMITAETRKYQLRRLHDASYGAMIPAAELYRGNFDAYSRLFIEIPLPVTTAGLHRQPGGTYLRAFCKGPWDVLPERYREILDFAEERGLVLSGFSYEMGINESVIDRIEDYIVQIEIPVQPRQTT